MVQGRPNYAAEKDAQIKSSAEECARDMGQRSNYAVLKDAQMVLREEECAGGMGHFAIQMMNRS